MSQGFWTKVQEPPQKRLNGTPNATEARDTELRGTHLIRKTKKNPNNRTKGGQKQIHQSRTGFYQARARQRNDPNGIHQGTPPKERGKKLQGEEKSEAVAPELTRWLKRPIRQTRTPETISQRDSRMAKD